MSKLFRIAESPREVEEILNLISHAPAGQDILSEFLPHYRLGKITIKVYPEDVAVKLRASHSAEQPSGASFVTDGRSGVIYVDLKSELGILAPFLFHEIVHSLDERLWMSARRNLNESERAQVVFAAEQHAFECQYRFVQELLNLVPELDAFFARKYPKARILREKLSPVEIKKLYGIKAA